MRSSLNPEAAGGRTLADLPIGAVAVVAAIVDASPDLRRRLLELGVLPGVRVTVIRRAPLGCPLEFDVGGARYAVRRETAAAVKLAPEGAS